MEVLRRDRQSPLRRAQVYGYHSTVRSIRPSRSWRQSGLLETVTKNWQVSAIYQVQSGFPFTISVFGDTANSGTVLGENPVRANYTGQPVFRAGTRPIDQWVTPAAFATPAAFTFGNAGRNTVYGPSLQT